jgi:hypothetical protein
MNEMIIHRTKHTKLKYKEDTFNLSCMLLESPSLTRFSFYAIVVKGLTENSEDKANSTSAAKRMAFKGNFLLGNLIRYQRIR